MLSSSAPRPAPVSNPRPPRPSSSGGGDRFTADDDPGDAAWAHLRSYACTLPQLRPDHDGAVGGGTARAGTGARVVAKVRHPLDPNGVDDGVDAREECDARVTPRPLARRRAPSPATHRERVQPNPTPAARYSPVGDHAAYMPRRLARHHASRRRIAVYREVLRARAPGAVPVGTAVHEDELRVASGGAGSSRRAPPAAARRDGRQSCNTRRAARRAGGVASAPAALAAGGKAAGAGAVSVVVVAAEGFEGDPRVVRDVHQHHVAVTILRRAQEHVLDRAYPEAVNVIEMNTVGCFDAFTGSGRS